MQGSQLSTMMHVAAHPLEELSLTCASGCLHAQIKEQRRALAALKAQLQQEKLQLAVEAR